LPATPAYTFDLLATIRLPLFAPSGYAVFAVLANCPTLG